MFLLKSLTCKIDDAVIIVPLDLNRLNRLHVLRVRTVMVQVLHRPFVLIYVLSVSPCDIGICTDWYCVSLLHVFDYYSGTYSQYAGSTACLVCPQGMHYMI